MFPIYISIFKRHSATIGDFPSCKKTEAKKRKGNYKFHLTSGELCTFTSVLKTSYRRLLRKVITVCNLNGYNFINFLVQDLFHSLRPEYMEWNVTAKVTTVKSAFMILVLSDSTPLFIRRKKKYNLRRTSKAFQPLKTAENWRVQYTKVISLGNWFWKIVVKYSKNPHHVRTCSAWQKRSFLNKTSLQFWWSKFWILIVWNFWQKVIVYMFSLIYICWEFHEKYVFHKATVYIYTPNWLRATTYKRSDLS